MVFVKKRSTEYAILDIINEIETKLDKKYSILLRKLNHHEVRRIINYWFASYLVGRQQTTQIGPKNISKKEVVLSGVPQGSVLGPLLFLIYINDISNSSDKLKFYLFADDTNLLYADKNLK